MMAKNDILGSKDKDKILVFHRGGGELSLVGDYPSHQIVSSCLTTFGSALRAESG